MKRIATPMVGDVITSTIMELMVYPAIFYLWRSQRLEQQPSSGGPSPGLPPPAGPIQPEPA